MKLVIGLGNPGNEYKNTRHNAGFAMLDELLDPNLFREDPKFQAMIVKSDWAWYVKPQTFMNNSGICVQKIMAYFKIQTENLIVIHDDLDVKIGDYKIQLGVGPKVHNGIRSIEQQLRQKNFWRVRIGVDGRQYMDRSMSGADYVLQTMPKPEIDLLSQVKQKIRMDVERLIES